MRVQLCLSDGLPEGKLEGRDRYDLFLWKFQKANMLYRPFHGYVTLSLLGTPTKKHGCSKVPYLVPSGITSALDLEEKFHSCKSQCREHPWSSNFITLRAFQENQESEMPFPWDLWSETFPNIQACSPEQSAHATGTTFYAKLCIQTYFYQS